MLLLLPFRGLQVVKQFFNKLLKKDGIIDKCAGCPTPCSQIDVKMNVELLYRNSSGKILKRKKFKNIVVNVGREQIVKMLAMGTSNPIVDFAWGDGGHNPMNPSEFTPATVTETALVNEVFRKPVAAFTFPSQTSVRFIGILEVSEIQGQEISEQGLFHQDNTMFARLAYPLIIKGPVQLEFRWTINL